jgi:hypothetical protein
MVARGINGYSAVQFTERHMEMRRWKADFYAPVKRLAIPFQNRELFSPNEKRHM